MQQTTLDARRHDEASEAADLSAARTEFDPTPWYLSVAVLVAIAASMTWWLLAVQHLPPGRWLVLCVGGVLALAVVAWRRGRQMAAMRLLLDLNAAEPSRR